MKMASKSVFALLFAGVLFTAVLCTAQVSAESSATEGQPESKVAPAVIPDVVPAQAPAPQAPPAPPPAISAQTPPVKKPGTEPAAAAPGDSVKRYVIGALDVLVIRVWGNPNLSGPVDVRSDGMISMPLVGEIKADGLTVEQLKTAISQRLTDYYQNNPDVDVQVAKVNSKKYFIYGGVNRAGPFPLVERTTVMDALSNAGGFRDFANTKKIEIHRGTKTFLFNFKDVSKGKNLDQDIELENGDRIVVPD
jgi:polysaccharide biosynthesis/export protein